MQPRISVLVPARNEERTLPTTLPTVLKAIHNLAQQAEVLVITPPTSPALTDPPVRDPHLRWLPTPRPGKFQALRVGADAARGEILLLVDADVLVETDALQLLAQPILEGTADVVAGRIELLSCSSTPTQRLLEQWMSASLESWHLLRTDHPSLRWALPGAVYGIRRQLFPVETLVPLLDDASIGIHANDAGAAFAYVPGAAVRTPAPASYRHWLRQKFRTRRGWAALAQLRADDVGRLEATLRRYLIATARDVRTHRLMRTQDLLLRTAARQSLRFRPAPSGTWNPARTKEHWLDAMPQQDR